MASAEPQGCFPTFLAMIFGKRKDTGPPSHPYFTRDDFLSPAELAFYRAVNAALRGDATICPKVRLADILFVSTTEGRQAAQNRIERKHVDFLICHNATMKPLFGLELDDSSHDLKKRQDRDEFVNLAFEAAALPLVRVKAARSYNPAQLRALFEPHLTAPPQLSEAKVTAAATNSGLPLCPKCGIPLVVRVAKAGSQAGQEFFGCPNYPRCKETRVKT